ncbi:MAG: peroxide stress protein YaaA [Myxococcota bacterium]
MLALLSPAKKLDFVRPLPDVAPTRPALVDHAAVVLAAAKARSKAQLAEAMDLSDDLATSTFDRFQALSLAADAPGTRPAVLAFAGEVYLGLDAPTLSVPDLQWAQDHVAILSGLYGLLRPLDAIAPYRLEMGTKLATARGPDLYAFWREVLAPAVDRAVEGHPDPTVLNLASDEYASAIDRKALRARVVTPVFQDVKDGKARAVFLFVKRARGVAARWLIRERADRVEALKDAQLDGYRFDPDASDDLRWVFRRPQPPPVQPKRAARKA